MARFRAEPGTWVSASMKSLGYDKIYAPDEAYGAYRGVAKSPSGKPLSQPDRLTPGQEYLIPVPGVAARTDPKTESARSGRFTPGIARPGVAAAPPAGAPSQTGPPLQAGAALRLQPPADSPPTLDRPPAFRPRLVPDPLPSLSPEPPLGPWSSLWELGPPGLALLALLFSGWSLSRQRGQYEERVRERALTWRQPAPQPPARTEVPSAKLASPDEQFRQKARLALQNELITEEEYLLALQTGVLIIEPVPGRAELMEKMRARLAAAKGDKKAYQAVIDELLKMKNSLTHLAVHIKSMGQMEGATVEIAVAKDARGLFLIAGLNSSAKWTPEQRNELKKLGIKVAPQKKWKSDSEVEGKKKNQPHAEENILWEIAVRKGKPIKFSNAPVGKGKPDSDVCPVCRRKIRDSGAAIEPGMHDESPAPKAPRVEGAPAAAPKRTSVDTPDAGQ